MNLNNYASEKQLLFGYNSDNYLPIQHYVSLWNMHGYHKQGNYTQSIQYNNYGLQKYS